MKNVREHSACATCGTRSMSVFDFLPPDDLVELNRHKSCIFFKKGQNVFNENALPQGLYCINKGKIKLSGVGVDGKEQILRLAKDGDVIGYRALLSNDRYHCSATALEDSIICLVEKDFFYSLIDKNKDVLYKIIAKISSDLKAAEDQIISLSQKNVRERTAEALLFFKATYGFLDDGITLNVTFSREEIADFVGTSTESIIRQLSEFNQDKVISLQGKKIGLLNVPKLLKYARVLD